MSRYQIKLRTNSADKGWYSLCEDIPEAMERCRDFLEETPEDRLRSGGKLKKLKGKLSGILQYDITDRARVQYWVDRAERIVYVEYVGYHL